MRIKSCVRLTLIGAMALACSVGVQAGPTLGEGGPSNSFTPPSPPPPLGNEVTQYISSLPTDGATVVDYNMNGYIPPPTAGLNDVDISWFDIAGATTGAYDRYWQLNTSAPPPPVFSALRFGAPTGNLGESDAYGEGYMFSVTARNVSFARAAVVAEPAPLLLIGIGLAALALGFRRSNVS